MPKAKEITKGLVVRNITRSGKAFDNEETAMSGNVILEASVDAIQNETRFNVITEKMFRGNYTQYATNFAEKIKKGGGKILQAPNNNDPNHCLLSGLTIKEANNLFSNHKQW